MIQAKPEKPASQESACTADAYSIRESAANMIPGQSRRPASRVRSIAASPL